jgi:acetyl esterase/lipase
MRKFIAFYLQAHLIVGMNYALAATLIDQIPAAALPNVATSTAQSAQPDQLAQPERPAHRQMSGQVDSSSDEDRAMIRAQRRAQRSQIREQKMAEDGIKPVLDIVYVPGSHIRNQQLDLFLPTGQTSKPFPLVIFIHGGGWRSGSRRAKMVLPLVKRGYAVASISYRLTPEAIWPAQIYDCKAAVRWVRAHAKEYNLDTNRIGAWGDSAGAHLAAMLGTSSSVKELEGDGGNAKYSSAVQAVCDWFGPTDLVTMLDQQHHLPVPPGSISSSSKNFVEWLLGGPVAQHLQAAKQASPVMYVTSKAPPFFIAHGDNDTTVPIAQSKELVEALKKAHVDVTFRIVPNAGHGTAAFPPQLHHDAFAFFDAKLHHASNSSEPPSPH